MLNSNLFILAALLIYYNLTVDGNVTTFLNSKKSSHEFLFQVIYHSFRASQALFPVPIPPPSGKSVRWEAHCVASVRCSCGLFLSNLQRHDCAAYDEIEFIFFSFSARQWRKVTLVSPMARPLSGATFTFFPILSTK